MVSLGRNFNMNTGSQTFLNTVDSGAAVIGGSNPTNDRQDLCDPILSCSNRDENFQKLKTIPVFSVHLLISSIISVVGIILAATWPSEKRCEAYFIMLYLRAVFWVITLIFDHVVKKQHDDLRLNGYHDFHRATAMQKGVAFYIVSLWNSSLLAIQAFLHHYYGDQFWEHCMQGLLSPISYIAVFNLAETIVLATTHGCYILKVYKFNKAAHSPDALRGADNSSSTLGLLQPGGNTAELLEKQADLIAYLRDHNEKLNKTLHQMQLHAHTLTI